MKTTWLEKNLIRLAGEDFASYTQCLPKTKRRLLFIGVVVLIIFILCFLSILEAFSELFASVWLGIVCGLFFGWVVTNSYLLLIHTLAKNLLVPEQIKSKSSMSYYIRIATVMFFALVVSKPIEHFLFQRNVQTELTIYKSKKIQELESSVRNSYSRKLQDVTTEAAKSAMIHEMNNTLARKRALIADANFYIHSIRMLTNKSWVWVVTLALMAVFIYPIYLKRAIEPDSAYYSMKRERQLHIIESEYKRFKKEYKLALSHFTDEQLEFVEVYTDPPFNHTIHRPKLDPFQEETLLEKIYE